MVALANQRQPPVSDASNADVRSSEALRLGIHETIHSGVFLRTQPTIVNPEDSGLLACGLEGGDFCFESLDLLLLGFQKGAEFGDLVFEFVV